ncbi:MAG TPA: MFS transporter, partial [Verrucomicrobiae bacterium]
EITHAAETTAATMVIYISICNGVGRLFWAWLSDLITRRWVFLTMFLLQAIVFYFMPRAKDFTMLAGLMMVVGLCYGGGFGTMPAFAADYFGPKNAGKVYGLMLTAWSASGVLGPMLIARVKDKTGGYDKALAVIPVLMILSAILPLIARPPKKTSE